METPNLGRVVNLVEERPVCRSTKGDLLSGPSQSFLDLLLTNRQGREMVIRVAVGEDVAQFYAE